MLGLNIMIMFTIRCLKGPPLESIEFTLHISAISL